MSSRRSLRRATVVAALVYLTGACSRSPERRPTHDLAAELERARLTVETTAVDFGSPEAHPHLVRGWSYGQRERSGGRSYAWSRAPEASVRFELLWPRDLDLELRGRPVRRAGPPIEVELVVNGTTIGTLTARHGVNDYRVRVPAAALRPGSNELALRYRGSWDTDPDWPRRQGEPLTIAWFHMRLGRGRGRPEPPSATGDGALRLPFGTRVDYHLKLPAESWLSVEGVTASGEGRGRLEVTVAATSWPEPLAHTLAGDRGEVRLTDGEAAIVRLSMLAIPDRPGEPGSGLLVRAPRITTESPDPAPPAGPAAGERTPPRPHIVVYLVDTLRADHLSSYGHPRPLSPEIDRFAGEATLFEHAVAQSSWTRPTVASIFTGLEPQVHGVNRPRSRLPEGALTMAEILAAAGYRTAGFVTNPNVSPPTGLAQGFEHYHWLESAPRRWRRADEVNSAVFDWLATADLDSPLFLYLHTIDPHDPYDPTPEFRGRFAPEVPADFPTTPRGRFAESPDELARLLALYEAEIAFNDLHFGKLLERLRQLGIYDDSLIVFLSDHGEEFAEHGGWKHGRTLFAESVNVPLIVKYPGTHEGLRIGEAVQQIDLLPTVLDYLGLEPPASLPGRSLLPFQSGGGYGERAIVTYLDRRGPVLAGLLDGRWKLIRRQADERATGRDWTFDVAADPAELDNLARERPIETGYLESALAARLRELGLAPEEAELSQEIEDQLRALGYLN